ncbi:MAG: SMI1/KNR4 family protein [Planctomycetaceae bacterium]|nr:SMI1/KNR4 family protein [Planctomycetaceae bacterium]
MSLWSDLTTRWAQSDLEIRPGVSAQQITTFEQRYSVALPQDLIDYFSFVDGMEDTMCADMFHFWKLEELRPVFDVLNDGNHDYADRDAYPNYFTFADYLISCWDYAVFLNNDRQQSAPVRFVTGTDSPGHVADDSFSSFMRRYCDDPNELLL